MTRFIERAILLAALALTLPVASCVGQATEHGVLVAVRGADTIVVERFRRTPDSLTGVIAVRQAGTATVHRIQYAAALAPQGLVSELVVAVLPGAGMGRRATFRARAGIDSLGAFAAVTGGADGRSRRLATGPGALLSFTVSLALVEQVLRRARNIPGDSVTVPVFMVDAEEMMPALAVFEGDSVRLSTAAQTLLLRTDGAGRLVGGVDPARGLRIDRVPVAPAGWLPDER